jgi:hypothetical protein
MPLHIKWAGHFEGSTAKVETDTRFGYSGGRFFDGDGFSGTHTWCDQQF